MTRWLYRTLIGGVAIYGAMHVVWAVKCHWFTTCRHGEPVLISGHCLCVERAK